MKRLVSLLVVLAMAYAVAAQVPDDQTEAYYAKIYSKLYKEYVKRPDDVAINVELAAYYSDTVNPKANLPQAMRHISAAETRYVRLVTQSDRASYKEVSKLMRKKITVNSVRQSKRDIVALGERALSSASPMGDALLDNYAKAFKGEAAIVRLVDSRRLQNRFRQAEETNTLAAYKSFYGSYPSTLESEEADRRMGLLATGLVRDARREGQVDTLLAGYMDVPSVQRAAMKKKSALAYAKLATAPSAKGYKNFLTKYPGSDEYSLVLAKMDELTRQEFNTLSTARQYADFALENPDNPLAEKAIERLKQLITDEHDLGAVKIYLEEFPLDVNYNDIYLEYYKWHTEEGNRAPIDRFAAEHPDFPYRMAIDDALALADKVDSIDLMAPFVEKEFGKWASKVYHLTGKKVSYVALQRTLQQMIANKQWNKIPGRLNFFALSFEDECVEEVAELRGIVSAAANPKIAFTPVVRPSYDMEHPVMHPDGQALYYNRTVNGITSIQMATPNGNVWRSQGDVVFTNAVNQHLRIYSFFDGGEQMLLGQDGDILTAQMADSHTWTVTGRLPQPVNSPYNDFDACMLPDGSGILFASDRPGGHNMQPSGCYFHGDTAVASDIYYAPRTATGWGEPLNLGFHVNSPYMECSPAISDDLKTLYFVTDGRGGLGYGDLYYTTRDDIGDWTHWAKPTNYGKEVNSGMDEASAVMNADGVSLTVSSNASGHYGCYQLTAAHTVNDKFRTVHVVAGETGMSVDVVDLTTKKTINRRERVEREGEWQSSFYADKQYLLMAECRGLYLPGLVFKPSEQTRLTPEAYDEERLLIMSETDTALVLPALVFEEGEAFPAAFAETEIDHLAGFMQSHPSLGVELAVHVAGNDDARCFNLSNSRGQEIKKRLVSKGIDADRIAVTGYGNSHTKRGAATTSVTLKARSM